MAYQGFQIGLTGMFYKFRTDIITPPDLGEIRFDNPDPTLVTHVYLSFTDIEGDDVEQLMSDWPDIGTILVIQSTTDTSQYFQFEITAITLYAGSYADWTVVPKLVSPVWVSNNEKVHIAASIIGTQQPLSVKSGQLQASEALKTFLAGHAGEALVVKGTEDGFELQDELETVAHDATLSGDGTLGSPLSVNFSSRYTDYVTAEAEQSEGTSTPLSVLTWSETLDAGEFYRGFLSFEYGNTSVGGMAHIQVKLDGTELNKTEVEPQDGSSWYPGSAMAQFAATGTHTVEVLLWNIGPGTARIRRIRLSVEQL